MTGAASSRAEKDGKPSEGMIITSCLPQLTGLTMTYKASYNIPRRHSYTLQRMHAIAFQQACRSFKELYKVDTPQTDQQIANWNAEYAFWVDFWHVNHISESPSVSEGM